MNTGITILQFPKSLKGLENWSFDHYLDNYHFFKFSDKYSHSFFNKAITLESLD